MIGALLVPKIARLFDRSFKRSVGNWFLGRGKLTFWPSKSNKKSLHTIHSGDHRKSFRKATSLLSRLVQAYFAVAGSTKALRMSSNGSKKRTCRNWWVQQLKCCYFLSTFNQCISHRASGKALMYFIVSENAFSTPEPMLFFTCFNAVGFQCLRYNLFSGLTWPLQQLASTLHSPCGSDELSSRLRGLIQNKALKSGSPSLARAYAKLKSSSSVLIPRLIMSFLTSTFVKRTGFAGALDALLFSSNFLLFFWLDTLLNLSDAFLSLGIWCFLMVCVPDYVTVHFFVIWRFFEFLRVLCLKTVSLSFHFFF